MTIPSLPTELSIRFALRIIENDGLQAPRLSRLSRIVQCAHAAVTLLQACAVEPPSEAELRDVFDDFVLRAVNRAPGVGDVVAD